MGSRRERDGAKYKGEEKRGHRGRGKETGMFPDKANSKKKGPGKSVRVRGSVSKGKSVVSQKLGYGEPFTQRIR